MHLLKEEIAKRISKDCCWPGLLQFSDNLVDIIPRIPFTSPVLLSGDWGSGKSTVLNHIKETLDGVITGSFPNNIHHAVVIFEAWRYEQEDNLLPSLIRGVYQANKAPKGTAKKWFEKALAGALALGARASSVVAAGYGFAELAAVAKGSTIDKWVKEYEAAGALVTQFEPTKSLCDELGQSFFELLKRLYQNKSVTILIDDLDRCSPCYLTAYTDF